MVNRDRGQLILAGAILVALTIVASAILLNSIHFSADVQSQNDRQTLDRTERTIGQIERDIGRITMRNESEERLPYFEDTTASEERLNASINEYERQYQTISTVDKNGFTSIEYQDSSDGVVVWQNSSNQDLVSPGNPLVIDPDQKVPFVNITLTEVGDFRLEVSGTVSPTHRIIVDDAADRVEVEDGTNTFSCSSLDPPIEITIIDGEGEVRSGGEHCATIDFGSAYDTNGFEITAAPKGELYIAYQGTSGPAPAAWDSPSNRNVDDDVRVMPVFEVTYQTPEVYYRGNVTIYGETA
jgi:hypothetical protein